MKRLMVLPALALVVAACGTGTPDTTGAGTTATTTGVTTGSTPAATTLPPIEKTSVKLQLQWVTQAQFAGYFAAVEQGWYAEQGLDVEILEGAVDIVPQTVVAGGAAEFGLAWVPKALVSREEGAKVVNIAQVFQRSGTLEVSWADSGITKPEDWAGKKVGNWGFGNEFELTAAIEKFNVQNVELVPQQFDMAGLLNNEIDAAEAMIYNEYAQVLEVINTDTGALYTPADLNVIDFNTIGTAMLQDAVWVSEEWLAQPGNEDIATRFLIASFQGWAFCRNEPQKCVDIVLARGSALGGSHQAWQMNEINALIWPSPNGIGVMDKALWDQTVEVATSQSVIKGVPDETAYRTDLAAAAVAALTALGVDVNGTDFAKTSVTLNEGGV